MRSVVEADWAQTLAAYALLLEHDFLEGAQAMDARYHQAKLFGLMMTEEGAQYAWREHQEIRARLMGTRLTSPAMSDQQFMDAVARIHRKLQQAGLRQPDSGVMN